MAPREQAATEVGFKSGQGELHLGGGKRGKGLAPYCSGLRVEKAAEMMW